MNDSWAGKRESGFTLVEILVVILIISILVTIAIPIYRNASASADQRVHDANVRILHSVTQVYMVNDWDEKAKSFVEMKAILADYLFEGAYPVNPTKSGDYEVTIDDQGKITVSPGIGEY